MEPQNCQLHNVPSIAEGMAEDVSPSLSWRLKLILKRRLSPGLKRSIKRWGDGVIETVSRHNGSEIPATAGAAVAVAATVTAAAPAVASAHLEAGDIVRVRSKEEIRATLNHWGEAKGCGFMPEMEQFCNTTQTVFKVVRRFIDERDYQAKRVKGIVLLHGVLCQGIAPYGPCDRSCFFFWREEWLEKIDASRQDF